MLREPVLHIFVWRSTCQQLPRLRLVDLAMSLCLDKQTSCVQSCLLYANYRCMPATNPGKHADGRAVLCGLQVGRGLQSTRYSSGVGMLSGADTSLGKVLEFNSQTFTHMLDSQTSARTTSEEHTLQSWTPTHTPEHPRADTCTLCRRQTGDAQAKRLCKCFSRLPLLTSPAVHRKRTGGAQERRPRWTVRAWTAWPPLMRTSFLCLRCSWSEMARTASYRSAWLRRLHAPRQAWGRGASMASPVFSIGVWSQQA